jgi:iron complex outermembrane receptor protein
LIGHLPTATTVKLLYGEAFRAPSVWELEYHDPPSGYISNTGLGPEQIQTFEMVLEQRIATGLFMNVSLFHYEMSGLIDYLEIETPDSLLSFGDTMFRYDNVDGANTMGVEAEITAVLSSGPRGYFSYTFQDAKQADPLVANDRLSNSPPHLVKLGLSTPILGQVTVGGNLLYESGRLTVFDTETDDYFLMDLNVATRPLVAGLSFSATVKNVFNNGYWVPGGWEHAQPALPQRGREVLVRARWHWQ